MRRLAVVLALAVVSTACCGVAAADTVKVGSKRFTESYILGELLAQVARGEHRPGLGNTAILYEALRAGAIDVYPEYTGTIAREILKTEDRLDLAGMNARLRPLGLEAGVPLGFSNSYGLGMPRAKASKRISDLRDRRDLRVGFSHEFLGRRDGWPGLRDTYGLKLSPRGLDHGLAYEALKAGELDLMDVYTTDAKIERYDIAVLQDDKGFFPSYEAVLLYRLDAARKIEPLRKLEKSLDESTMIRLNARAEIDKMPFQQVAAEFLGEENKRSRTLWSAIAAPDFGRLLLEHLWLVFGSLVAATVIGIPLGMVAARYGWLEQPVLILTGIVQTIPSLALLAFLIPITGMIGVWPALIALFLYALLPITRNTHAGLLGVPVGLKQAGTAIGLDRRQVLRLVEVPIALPTIMAGIKTSAVINVGTATIAAFIGAGGFGERISQGLALNDHNVLLAGALPAAALALLVHGAFEMVERTFLSHR
ncbi:MAG TPA: glycine betaine ABC transporter substrate-binding protein [Burkholderiales bacterium]|nr:glycine betaine ABC transporter substrate-binding protein [Burkholderiales bacterium]